jgi:hypothetical protein
MGHCGREGRDRRATITPSAAPLGGRLTRWFVPRLRWSRQRFKTHPYGPRAQQSPGVGVVVEGRHAATGLTAWTESMTLRHGAWFTEHRRADRLRRGDERGVVRAVRAPAGSACAAAWRRDGGRWARRPSRHAGARSGRGARGPVLVSSAILPGTVADRGVLVQDQGSQLRRGTAHGGRSLRRDGTGHRPGDTAGRTGLVRPMPAATAHRTSESRRSASPGPTTIPAAAAAESRAPFRYAIASEELVAVFYRTKEGDQIRGVTFTEQPWVNFGAR